MNIIVNLKENVIIYDLVKRITIGVISIDYGLIRYLLKIMQEYELTVTKSGYLQFLNKEGETYLHRIIMEYYAQFNNKLFTILSNPNYEVNHKNKKKWDNRLENLEMVTRLGNERHNRNKAYDEEIVFTTDELIEIETLNKLDKDRKFLEKVNKSNLEFLSIDSFNYTFDSSFYKQPYIKCNNVTIPTLTNTYVDRDINTLESFNNTITSIVKNTFSKVHQNNYIYYFNILNSEYNYSRIKILAHHNLKLIKKYYNNNKYFRAVCEKYCIYTTPTRRVYTNIKDDKSYMEPSVIEYIYKNMIHGNHICKFYQNTLLTNFNAQGALLNRGRYNIIRIIFFLGLFDRMSTNYTHIRTKHKSYSYSIHKYTDEFFTSTVLPRAKKLYDMGLTKITHTILAKNFGEEIANMVYCNANLTKSTERNVIIIDQIKLLLSSTLLDEINIYGFITFTKIRRALKDYNDNLMNQSLPYCEITEDDGARKFICGIIRNVTDIKELLKDLKIEYHTINKNTKQAILEFQKKNGIEDTTETGLYYQQKILVLKKLYRTSR